MKPNVILLEPFLDHKIWGGKKLINYNYKIGDQKIGEALVISALKDKTSIILNKNIKEKTLFEFFNNNPDFFGNYKGQYPLLTKIIDANDDLSVQVHPDNQYAMNKHGKLGKTECWYILDAKNDASIIYGLAVNNKEEMINLIKNNEWNKLLKEKKVKKGDLIYVPSGTVHAIKSGIMIYELQQSSDITYRLYDYNRLENNKPRELHIEDSINVIKFNEIENVTKNNLLVDSDFFKLLKLNINSKLNFDPPLNSLWLEITVIEGEGKIDDFIVKKGSAAIVRHNHSVILNGNMELLISYITK